MAWTYSDWVTYADGSAKLARLRLHVQEVSDKLSNPDYSTEGLSVSRSQLPGYLSTIKSDLASLESRVGASRVTWASGRAVL
jgi:hypothetical protein